MRVELEGTSMAGLGSGSLGKEGNCVASERLAKPEVWKASCALTSCWKDW